MAELQMGDGCTMRCDGLSPEIRGLRPASAQGLEVCARCVSHCRGPSEVRACECPLVEVGDIGVPPTALGDDPLCVGAEDVPPVCGAADAEALASKLGWVKVERR